MASGSFKQNLVQCPFYKEDDGWRRITCEGLVDHSSVSLSYRNSKDYLIQLNTFCCDRYKYCEVYQMVMKTKYDEED